MKYKNQFHGTIKTIEDNREVNLEKLIKLSFEKLDDMKKYYYNWYTGAEESGYKESAIVNYLHFSIIEEAIAIKQKLAE